MTEHEALADEDFLAPTGLADTDYLESDWDAFAIDDWETYPAERHRPQPPATPWFRNPRLLFGLIATAAAALVVATVLLITGKQSGEIPTTPQLSTRSTAATPSERSAPSSPSESTSPTPSSASSSAESSDTATEEVPAPVDPPQQAEAPPVPPPAPATGQSRSPAGPKINVTRTPMSFTPGKH